MLRGQVNHLNCIVALQSSQLEKVSNENNQLKKLIAPNALRSVESGGSDSQNNKLLNDDQQIQSTISSIDLLDTPSSNNIKVAKRKLQTQLLEANTITPVLKNQFSLPKENRKNYYACVDIMANESKKLNLNEIASYLNSLLQQQPTQTVASDIMLNQNTSEISTNSQSNPSRAAQYFEPLNSSQILNNEESEMNTAETPTPTNNNSDSRPDQ